MSALDGGNSASFSSPSTSSYAGSSYTGPNDSGRLLPITHTGDAASPFEDLGLDRHIAAALSRAGIKTPTPIQAGAIPAALSGSDIVGIAQTGTGKTLAFLLPLISKLLRTRDRVLVLVPTRELALQVEESLRSVTGRLKAAISSATIIGGAPMGRQCEELRRSPRIIVATPGRLIDHLERGVFKLSQFNNLVLDEADRMLDMGFLPAIRRIVALLPKERQTLLFSATFDDEMLKLAKDYLRDPKRIEVTPPGSVVREIKQELCYLQQGEKPEALRKLLARHDGPALVFSRTKHGASKLKKVLDKSGFDAAEIHSNRSMGQRKSALEGFKRGTYRVLVATDIAARGIDVQGIELVVNYDLPDDLDNYVHRIGRTARAGRTGTAISFATLDQHAEVLEIERLIKSKFELTADSATPPELPRRQAVNPANRRSRTNARPQRSFRSRSKTR